VPYFITNQSAECDGWATIKDDGEVIGCHESKDAAIAQMVAVSLAEGLEPGGERNLDGAPAIIVDIDGTLISFEGEPIRSVVDFVDDYEGAVLIVTSRVEADRAATIAELEAADVDWNELYMKPTADADSLMFKSETVRDLLDVWNLELAIENDAEVRAEYARLGITAVVPSAVLETGVRALPENYRPALAADVPEGRACGNCFFYDESNVEGDKAWCERWDEYVDGAYYCDAWRADEKGDESDDELAERVVDLALPEYIREAAMRGVEYYEAGRAGDGVVDRTIREARLMSRGEVSEDKVIRVSAWAARHLVDLDAPQNNDPDDDGFPGAGAVAFYLWGIDPLDPSPAIRWFDEKADQIREEERSLIAAAGGATLSTMDNAVETRRITVNEFELRDGAEGDGMTFTGYAAVFNSDSEPLPFTERIAPGAFSRSLRSRNEIKMFLNHDTSQVLASKRAGTLRLSEDTYGLRVEADLPQTSTGRDLAYLIKRGDISDMSFGFSVPRGGDSWSDDGATRELREVRLHEVSVVPGWPAYTATSASVRSLDGLVEATGLEADKLNAAITALENGDELDEAHASILDAAIGRLKMQRDDVAASLSLKQKQLDVLLARVS
jgi:HK97 family phage prohead protease